MAQVSGGMTPIPSRRRRVHLPHPPGAGTRIAHRNTGKLIGDSVGYTVMTRVAADENLHHLFYRDLATAAIAASPSTMMGAIERQVVGFQMPGLGIPGFAATPQRIAKAGVYDLAIHHEQILVPILLRHWQIDRSRDSTPTPSRPASVMARLAKSERAARRLTERRAEALIPA